MNLVLKPLSYPLFPQSNGCSINIYTPPPPPPPPTHTHMHTLNIYILYTNYRPLLVE